MQTQNGESVSVLTCRNNYICIILYNYITSNNCIFSILLSLVRFEADNWNKLKHICSKTIGTKMKVNGILINYE